MKHNEYKQLLQLSLFGELKTEEQLKLKEHLLTCEECRAELEDQKNLLELISGKQKVNVDEKVLSAARYQLRGALRAEKSGSNYFGNVLGNINQFFTTPLKFAAVSLTMLLLGVLIGSLFIGKSSQSEFNGQRVSDNKLTSLDESISISNLRFVDSDPSDGEVEFTFQASKPVRLKGKVDDPKIQSVLTYAMLNDQNPGSRFNSINVMDSYGKVALDKDIKDALVTVAMTDNNQGVRREALKLLGRISFDESVKQTYLFVLLNDSSSALRIEALNALIEAARSGHSLNQKDLDLVIKQAGQDDNNYIKLKSKTLLQEYN